MNLDRRQLRRAVKFGLIGGAVAVYTCVVGIIGRFDDRNMITDVIGLGRTTLLIIPLLFGYIATATPRPKPGEPDPVPLRGSQIPVAGLLAGLVTGAVIGLFVLIASAVELRSVLASVTASLLETLTFGQNAVVGALLLVAAGGLFGLIGAATRLLDARYQSPLFIAAGAFLLFGLFEPLMRQVLRNVGIETSWLYKSGGLTLLGAIVVVVAAGAIAYAWALRGETVKRTVDDRSQRFWGAVFPSSAPEHRRKLSRRVALFFLIAFLLYLPRILGIFLSEVVGTVGLFVLLGLGLNIVVGYAGLLDLGYVAFYAVGAYSMAILASPKAPLGPAMNFWIALPVVILITTLIGIFIGAPVLRLRGDYLAIVTLGFGEIARILAISNWFRPLTGGAQGILGTPDPAIGGFEFDGPQTLYYLILLAILLAMFVSFRLQGSRVGRAWNAMREDESVAESMGISIIKFKLLAFAMGAAVGSFGGLFFAVKIGSVFPHSLTLVVSIATLSLIILGGMGNPWGVIIGAGVLVGLPELLREFGEFRLLFYGAALVGLMILKPEGLLPSARRKAELHELEPTEQQYAERAGEEAGAPIVTPGPREA